MTRIESNGIVSIPRKHEELALPIQAGSGRTVPPVHRCIVEPLTRLMATPERAKGLLVAARTDSRRQVIIFSHK